MYTHNKCAPVYERKYGIHIILYRTRNIIILFALYNTGYTYHTYIQILHYKVARMPPKGLCEKPLAGRPPVPTP